MPGARLAVVEAKLLRALEALLDRPAQAGCAGKLGQGHAGRGEHEIVGPLVGLLPAAADQEPVLEGRVTGRRQGDPRPVRGEAPSIPRRPDAWPRPRLRARRRALRSWSAAARPGSRSAGSGWSAPRARTAFHAAPACAVAASPTHKPHRPAPRRRARRHQAPRQSAHRRSAAWSRRKGPAALRSSLAAHRPSTRSQEDKDAGRSELVRNGWHTPGTRQSGAPTATGCGRAAPGPPARPEASRSCAPRPTEAHPGKPLPSPAIPTGQTPARSAPPRPTAPAPKPAATQTKPQRTSTPSRTASERPGANRTLQT